MRCGSLGHPAFTGAVAVLAVNDHVLKPAVGGWWTGKLSDIAGVLVATVLLGTLTAAPRQSAVVVGAGFAALKLVPGVAAMGAPVLGGVTRRDPTDLVGLVMLVPAVALLQREQRGHRGHGRSEPIGRGGVPNGARTWSSAAGTVLLVVSGAVAVLATTASSCVSREVDGFAVGEDGSVRTKLGDSNLGGGEWAESADGGATWARSGEAPVLYPTTESVACSDDEGCFRVTGEAVEHRVDAAQPWRTSFAYSAEQRRRLDLRQHSCGLDPEFTAVAVVPRPEGDHVVVAMGEEGVLHRPPGAPGGAWERRAVLEAEPLSLDGPSWLARGTLLPFALLLGPIVVRVVRRRWPSVLAGPSVAAMGGAGLVMVGGGLRFIGVDYTVAGPLVAGLSVVVFVVSLALVRGPRAMRVLRPRVVRWG